MNEPLSIIMACCSDLAGQVRGKGFPARELEKRLRRGVGWTPTNVQITCFDAIADSPFGALDDLLLVPDPDTRFRIEADGKMREDAMLGDILTLDGDPWSCCTRSVLKSAVKRLQDVAGATLNVAFEHEFQLDPRPGGGSAYSLEGARGMRALGQRIFDLMEANGLQPDTFMKEYGPDQFEVTMDPAGPVRAADNAVILRELVRVAAGEIGRRATFTPIRDPESVGNGVHIHVSLNGRDGEPATHDPASPTGLSTLAASFVAGVCRFLPSILAVLAPSAISYYRLTPHRWSAAWNNLGLRDREAAVRICPVTTLDPADIARQFNVEIRACDAAASPYLQLAAIIHAGAEGIAQKLTPPQATHEDLDALDDKQIAELGYRRLPLSLPEALAAFTADETVTGWFGAELSEVYRLHKEGEMAVLDGLGPAERCARYMSVY